MELIKKTGATKCYISPGFDFEADAPDGDIILNAGTGLELLEIYKLYSKDPDDIFDENQNLFIANCASTWKCWNREVT